MSLDSNKLKAELGPIADKLRASPLLLVFVIAFSIVIFLAPAKVGLTIWGISKLALGGYVGYWVDRLSFRAESRPHRLDGIARGAAEKRRAWIVGAALIGASLLP
ncbi:hypothetical protein C7S18_12255 [Ahniella affigens]|uniref:Uncharacterized protein n=1 Tax=Ahniella affigens TaxID=2021234 RepID=A0A2P1PSW0_9GAMM|nr:putative holin [Ahniella affigens]AVP97924.1 hypothetical protein C7S18_12255 [Ahniella affigens]